MKRGSIITNDQTKLNEDQ